jgi:hypothetical protein
MAAGVSDRLWEVSDIVKLVESYRMMEGRENARKAIDQSYNSDGPALGF